MQSPQVRRAQHLQPDYQGEGDWWRVVSLESMGSQMAPRSGWVLSNMSPHPPERPYNPAETT